MKEHNNHPLVLGRARPGKGKLRPGANHRRGGSFAVLLAILLALFSSPLHAQGTPAGRDGEPITLDSLQLTPAEHDWLTTHRSVRIGIDPGYAPYSYLDGNGNFVGIAPDFLQRISAITGLTFEAVPGLSWPEILSGARERTLDVIATAVQTPERDGFLEFTQIYLPTPLMVTTRQDNTTINSPADLAGKRIALVEGYSGADRVLREHPGIIPLLVREPIDGLRMVSSGEADGYVGVLGVNVHLATTHGLANLKQATRYDLITFGQRFGVRKDWPELASILDKTLNRMSTREKNTILQHWIPVPTDTIEIPPFEMTAVERAWLAAHPAIRVGVMDAWPPMDYVDPSGQVTGIGVGFIEALNHRLGGVLKIKPGPWAENLQAVEEKRLDVIMDVTPRADREAFLNFTDPYVRVPHVIFARADAPRYRTLADLDRLRVGVERGFFIANVLRRKYPGIRVLEFDNTSDALLAVANHETDAYVGNRAAAKYAIRNELISGLTEHGKIDETASVNAIGIRKDWLVLHGILQRALESVTEQERNAILQDWVEPGIDASTPQFNLTSEEWAWLAEHPVIRVAIDRNWPPIEFVGNDELYQGLAVEYLDRLSQMLGVRFAFEPESDRQVALGKLRERSVDLFPAVASTETRNEFISFTTPYLRLPAVIFTTEDVPYINGTKALAGKKVAVLRGHAITEYMRRFDPAVTLVEVKNIVSGLEQVHDGRVDAYIGSILATSYTIRKHGYDTIRASGQAPYRIDVAMAARSDWPIFQRILQKALDAIPDRDKASFEARWIGSQAAVLPDYTVVWQVAAGAGFLLLLFFGWNWHLRGKTARQESSLQDVNAALRQETIDRREAEESLRRSQKMEAIGQLTGGLAHDFNNMLAVLIGNTEMLERMVPQNTEMREYIDGLKRTIGRAASLTQRLLAFSRQQTLAPAPTDVGQLIDDLADLVQRTLGETVELRLSIATGLWPALIDGSQLDHALLNLAINARDAMPGGGALTIEAANATLSASYAAQHGEVSPGDYVRVAVRDTGHGIAPEIIEKVFEPFYTTKDVGKGSGLGLSMVYGFVKQSGGHIVINSEVGQGTTVEIYLPRAQGSTNPAAKRAIPANLASTDSAARRLDSRTKRILVVEDNPDVLNIPVRVLRDHGYEVFGVRSGAEALARLNSGLPFDLLFTDIVLPGGINGVDVAAKANQMNPEIKVIYTTGYAESRVPPPGGDEASTAILQKPYSRDDLLATIRTALTEPAGT